MPEDRRHFCVRKSTVSKMIKQHPTQKNKNDMKSVKFLHFVPTPADRFKAVFFVMNDDWQKNSISPNFREVVPENIIRVVSTFRIALQFDTSARKCKLRNIFPFDLSRPLHFPDFCHIF